ncbi:MAG: hypothetical protein ACYTGZ_06440 [Planctomycetota bacterium]|jgi:cell division protein FtsL
MRDLVTWGTAIAFLLAALYAVTVRREMVTVGRSIGRLSHDVAEFRRRNDNLALEVSRLRSPGALDTLDDAAQRPTESTDNGARAGR